MTKRERGDEDFNALEMALSLFKVVLWVELVIAAGILAVIFGFNPWLIRN